MQLISLSVVIDDPSSRSVTASHATTRRYEDAFGHKPTMISNVAVMDGRRWCGSQQVRVILMDPPTTKASASDSRAYVTAYHSQ